MVTLSIKKWDRKDLLLTLFMFVIGIALFFVISPSLFNMNFIVPLANNGDGLGASVMMKTTAVHGWYMYEPHLAAGEGNSYALIPMADSLHFFLVKILGIFTKEPGLLYNLFFISGFGLVSATSYIASRQVLNPLSSIVISILYAFMPYHQLRLGHIFLTHYYMLPLAIIICVKLMTSQIAFPTKKEGFGWKKNRAFYLSTIAIFLTACTGMYYAFFIGFSLCVAFAYILINHKKISQSLKACFALIITLCIGTVVNILPAYQTFLTDTNTSVSARSWHESEFYGLKLIHLMLPRFDHHIGLFRKLNQAYQTSAPLYESESAALGLLAFCGFCLLLLCLFQRKKTHNNGWIHSVAVLNVSMFLLATIGGFGTIFAMFISSAIRCYNRISILIAFCALLMIGYLFEWFLARFSSKKIFIGILIGVIGVAGLWDQTAPMRLSSESEKEFFILREFITNIEEYEPTGSTIFQLPYRQFPIDTQVGRLTQSYTHMAAYQHSKDLVWSYGYNMGTLADVRYRLIANLPVNEMVAALADEGYAGIYLNRNGYTEQDITVLEEQLAKLLNGPVYESSDGAFAYYHIDKESLPFSEGFYEKVKKQTTVSVITGYKDGFYHEEQDDTKPFRWMMEQGTVQVKNLSDQEKTVKLSFSFIPNKANGTLLVSGLTEAVFEDAQIDQNIDLIFTMAPGQTGEVFFDSTYGLASVPGETRELSLKLYNLKVETLSEQEE